MMSIKPKPLIYKGKHILFLVLLSAWLLPAGSARAARGWDEADEATRTTRTYRFEYGLNLGTYFAHASTANFYNGSRQPSLEQLISSGHHYQRIRHELGYDFRLDELPRAMRYQPAMMLGFYGNLHFNDHMALVAEFNYTRLKTEDQFTIELDRHSNIAGDNIQRHRIAGSEERVELRLGIQLLPLSGRSTNAPFVETGFSLTDTRVLENQAFVAGERISLFYPPTAQTPQFEREYGMSSGLYAVAGLQMEITESFAFTLAYSTLYTRINLGGHKQFHLQHMLFCRLNLHALFGDRDQPPADFSSFSGR